MNENAANTITYVALTVSAVSAVIAAISAYLLNRYGKETERLSIIPILVFTRQDTLKWAMKNCGNGPALDVLVADKKKTDWHMVTLMYPLGAGESVGLENVILEGHGLAVMYYDVKNRPYTTRFDIVVDSKIPHHRQKIEQTDLYHDFVPTHRMKNNGKVVELAQ